VDCIGRAVLAACGDIGPAASSCRVRHGHLFSMQD
jgi:hypothetical protein